MMALDKEELSLIEEDLDQARSRDMALIADMDILDDDILSVETRIREGKKYLQSWENLWKSIDSEKQLWTSKLDFMEQDFHEYLGDRFEEGLSRDFQEQVYKEERIKIGGIEDVQDEKDFQYRKRMSVLIMSYREAQDKIKGLEEKIQNLYLEKEGLALGAKSDKDQVKMLEKECESLRQRKEFLIRSTLSLRKDIVFMQETIDVMESESILNQREILSLQDHLGVIVEESQKLQQLLDKSEAEKITLISQNTQNKEEIEGLQLKVLSLEKEKRKPSFGFRIYTSR